MTASAVPPAHPANLANPAKAAGAVRSQATCLVDDGHGAPDDADNDRLATLRRRVARLETAWLGIPPAYLPLGLLDIHHHLPGPGLPCGALHEVIAAAYGDTAAAFGFTTALTACALQARSGAALLVVSRRATDIGMPYGHGLRQLGLDVGRLLIVETRTGKDALWAIEDILRARAGVAAVMGLVDSPLDLTMSRRLNLAAAGAGTPLFLLRPPAAAGASAATTRWRIAAAPAGRDRFGAFAGGRWHVALDRCRNGRSGQWTVEWDHVAYRFRLAEVLADRASSARAPQERRRAAV